MSRARRKPPKVDITGDVRENVFRGQVNAALQRDSADIDSLDERVTALEEAGGGGGSSGAPASAQYLCLANDGTLTAERRFVPGTGLSAVDGGANGNYTLNCTVTSGAPTGAQYVTLATDAGLSAERVLTPGHGLDMTDGGANGAVTFDVDESELNFATPVSTGVANAAGAANTLARSDHVHAISAASFEQGTVLYEVDFSALANNTLTAGTEVIDGLSWTVAGDTFLNTFDISNGNGLRMIAGNSLGTHSTWTSATQDSPYLYLPLSSITAWNGTSDIIVDLYISALTLESANEYVFCAFWTVAADPHGTSSARVRKYTWIQTAGGIVPSVTINAGQTNGSEVRSGQDVMSLRMGLNTHAEGYWSTWSSGWPAQQNGTVLMTTSGAVVDPMLRSTTRLVIGIGVLNDASATTRATIQRMRVRRA